MFNPHFPPPITGCHLNSTPRVEGSFSGKPSAPPFSLNPHEKYRVFQSDMNQLPVLCRVSLASLTRRVLV